LNGLASKKKNQVNSLLKINVNNLTIVGHVAFDLLGDFRLLSGLFIFTKLKCMYMR